MVWKFSHKILNALVYGLADLESISRKAAKIRKKAQDGTIMQYLRKIMYAVLFQFTGEELCMQPVFL